jgi:pre-mRNA-processing factor 19
LDRLSKSRRKRPIPEGWATSESISAYKPSESTESFYPGGKTLSINSSGDSALVETAEGVVGVFSLSQKQIVQTLQINGPVTDAIWAGEKAVVASSTGSVQVFEGNKEAARFSSHAGTATSLALHATGDIVASVGADKSYVLYDLTTNAAIMQNFSDACKHPPLHLQYLDH